MCLSVRCEHRHEEGATQCAGDRIMTGVSSDHGDTRIRVKRVETIESLIPGLSGQWVQMAG